MMINGVFLCINMMFGQLCICYVLIERSFTKLLITTNKTIYSSEGKQKQNKAIFFHLFLFFELSSVIHHFKVCSFLDFLKLILC